MELLAPKFARTASCIVTLVVGAALLMEVNVLNPAGGGGRWFMFLWGPATIVWAVGALRNHPIRSTREVFVFVATAIIIGVLLNVGLAGGMILLTGVGVGMLFSSFGTPKRAANVPNPYRNHISRIFMGVSGITMLAHASRVVFYFASSQML